MMTKSKLSQSARLRVGGFSSPSKMPSFAWSIPASRCHTGSKLAKIPGSVCFDCYALKGFYQIPNVQACLENRFDKLNDLEVWTANMIELIPLTETSSFFRWFDSGDLQSVEHLEAICTIARFLPKIKFWLPTKEYGFVQSFLENGGTIPKNLVVRLSAYMIGKRAPALASKLNVQSSTVSSGHGFSCRAPKQGNKCLDCRACWNKQVKNIDYKLH